MSRMCPPATLMLLALLAGMAAVSGCQSDGPTNHEKWVKNANNRWRTMRSGVMLDMARQQFETGNLPLAKRTLEKATSLDPTNAKLHVLAGRIALERGKLERAYRLLERAMNLDPELAEAHYYQGLILQRWNRPAQAGQQYEQAYKQAPDNVDYLLARVEMLVPQDRVGEAIRLLKQKRAYFTESAALRAELGHFWKLKDRPDLAAEAFHEASLMASDQPEILSELAMARREAGQMKKAVRVFEQLFRQFPQKKKRASLRRAFAEACMARGHVDRARSIYLQLARRENPEAQDWLHLAKLAWGEGDPTSALQAANRAVTLAPKRAEPYLIAGLVWQKRNQVDKALRMFDKAADLSKGNAAPLILRGLTLQQAGRRDAAAEAYRAAIERAPRDTRAQRLLNKLTGQVEEGVPG